MQPSTSEILSAPNFPVCVHYDQLCEDSRGKSEYADLAYSILMYSS